MTMKVVWYRTARQCLAAFCDCRPNAVAQPGWIMVWEGDGYFRRKSRKVAYRSILDMGCWGFCAGKRTLHLWISRRANRADALGLVAHELGHCQRPHCRDKGREEQKANKFDEVAVNAMRIILDRKRNSRKKEADNE